MTIRAIIFDIYKTLLEVGPPPADAGKRWEVLCRSALPETVPLTLAELAVATENVIARQHAVAKTAGVPCPEIFWPAVMAEAWPALASLDARALDDFLFEHAQLQRTVRLMSGAAEVLNEGLARQLLLGLVSNSQPYTLRELDAALSVAGQNRTLFQADLVFLSFEHGFSKPDPHVFRLLAARLAQRGITPGKALIVGDREDNDVRPARAQGFRTWHLVSGGAETSAGRGDWRQLRAALGGL